MFVGFGFGFPIGIRSTAALPRPGLLSRIRDTISAVGRYAPSAPAESPSITDTPRRGLLTQASILTLTSHPTRTSPVKRGKWILENILGTPPPPPPPDVPELVDDGAALTGSLRQRMEQHRANPNCAVCHQRMDPLGFGFENFDAIGAWRDKDGKFAIDPSGQLPGGASFRGPAELRQILKGKQQDFCRCLAHGRNRGSRTYDST